MRNYSQPRSAGTPIDLVGCAGRLAASLQTAPGEMTLFFYRVMGAAVLDGGSFEGVEANPRVTWQAAGIVVLSSVAAGIGAGGLHGLDTAAASLSAALALVGSLLFGPSLS